MMDLVEQAVRLSVKYWPEIAPLLSRKARHMAGDTEVKTYEYYRRTIINLVESLWEGFIGGEFVDIMYNLIHGQLSDAYEKALMDAELSPEEATPEMREQVAQAIQQEQQHVQGFFRDIVIAKNEGETIDQFLTRAEIWANRYNDVYNQAKLKIAGIMGKKLEWVLGDAEHCSTCLTLAGKVAYAAEWEKSGFHPQQPPNKLLECGGWNCACSLVPTDKRKSYRVAQWLIDFATNRLLGG